VCKLFSKSKATFDYALNLASTEIIARPITTHEKSIATKLKEECMLAFCHSDESSTIDSNSRRIIDVIVDGVNEKHVGRVWNVFTLNEKYELFLQSETVEECMNRHPSFSPPSRSLFHKSVCKCVRNPTSQSCVDIIASAQVHGFCEEFIDETCCPKVPHPNLKCGYGSTAFIPKFTKWKCANGECNACGIENKLRISECTILTQNTTIVEVMEWKDAPRAGTNSKGVQNTQLELTKSKDTVSNIISKLLKQSETFRLHLETLAQLLIWVPQKKIIVALIIML